MENTVRSFNALSRERTTPSGLPNLWAFGVRHVPIEPEGDLVVVVHPPSRYLLSAGPAQILSLPSAPAKAKALVPLLLDAFLSGNSSSGALSHTSEPFFAPWSWYIDDPKLVPAIERELRLLGVEGALCRVKECSAKAKAILEECWLTLLERLTGMAQTTSKQHTGPQAITTSSSSAVELDDRSRCHGCGSNRESFATPLKKCSACGKAWYHSRDCQRQHWKQHKKACLANRSGANTSPASASGANPTLDPYTYYNQIARRSFDAQDLLWALRLDPASPEGTAKPLRRLVITGQDSPENIQRLFGPGSLSTMKQDHENARIEALLDPPRGSPSHKVSAVTDDPSLARSVRPPTKAEQQKLQEVREIQQLIRQKVGAGKSPSSGDMMSILTSFGPDWAAKMPLYILAANTMDQGVYR
ncbi:uncharacterized protein LY79DRAFT_547449 [Colletotrichum navitas]|uniref:MYND-type domain-containing protein n=1 Tax=Colletotrichum navitas TaxID=681940 RepID=A0AAD8Q4A5_9PEZI|nr:uncharacterized protein LY79DRAFT_547449 [Colletotrichum navitas]KAK1595345.1 hypothetical protein LY79DRAFT_547449 [Colletotrichum navitas]